MTSVSESDIVADLRNRAVTRTVINSFDSFEIGQIFEHHWGRTITGAEATLFSTLSLNFNPLYFNAEHARANGHPDLVVCPMLVFTTVFGLSVQDLSEAGGFFLGVDDLEYGAPVYPGDTLTARSEVTKLRQSESRPGAGIATWRTTGFNQKGEQVATFLRTNLVNIVEKQ